MRHPLQRICVTMAILSAGAQLWAAAPAPATEAGGTVVLTAAGPWRWHIAWRPARLTAPAGELELLPVDRTAWTHRPDIQGLATAPPPAGWAAADFDDSDWPRDSGRWPADGLALNTGLLALRCRLVVTDPAAVKSLRLAASFRGGMVVYLNGREVARGGLPEGDLSPMAAASPYPDDVWVDAKGRFLPAKDNPEAVARRSRTLGPVDLPTDALRKGVNVIAVALHRSDYHPGAVGWYANGRTQLERWAPIGLSGLELRADGGGIVAAQARPAGPAVWNIDPQDRLDDGWVANPADPLGPVRIIAARNGVGLGAVAVSSPTDLAAFRATLGDLAGEGGRRIPASAATVRCEVPGTIATPWGLPAYDGLVESPPATVKPRSTRTGPSAALVPVLVSLQVPPDAAAGDYRGTLTVSADGLAATAVPVELTVVDWLAPDPLKCRTVVNLYQSPTSEAMRYKVPMWSDAHWKLMERAFTLLGQVGCDIVNIPLIEHTQFGNDEGFVFWIDRPDGTFDYDFSVLDRYIELAHKHLGSPRFVVLHVFHAAGWAARKPDQQNTVTVIDPKTRRRVRSMQVPVFGTPEGKAFWAPVLDAVRAKLARAGMDKSICIGILADGDPDASVVSMFKDILPDAGWMKGCHRQVFTREPIPMKGGGVLSLVEFCYSLFVPDPAKKVATIWDQPGPGVAYIRKDFDDIAPVRQRVTAERGLFCNTAGVGRFCLDFWPFAGERGQRATNLYNRWPESSCDQREPTTCRLAFAGPDGPEPTVRFELFRQGLTEAEATIVLAEAAYALAADVGPQLAARCKAMVAERANLCRLVHESSQAEAWDYVGWRDQSARLYGAAAEVQKKLAGK